MSWFSDNLSGNGLPLSPKVNVASFIHVYFYMFWNVCEADMFSLGQTTLFCHCHLAVLLKPFYQTILPMMLFFQLLV